MLGGTQNAWIKYGCVIALVVLLLFLICYNNGRKAKFASDYGTEETHIEEEEEEAVPLKKHLECFCTINTGSLYFYLI